MNFSAFISYILLTAYTPGPNNIMALSNAGRYGFRKAFRFILGVLLGFLIDMILCAVLTSLLYSVLPAVKPVMLCIGAAYILFLAFSVWRDKPHAAAGPAQTNSAISGMLLQFVNVKVLLYGITAMSSFILPHYRSPVSVALFVLLLTMNGFVGTCVWAAFGAAFEKLFRKYGKLLNTVMALLLVYCAASMVWEIWK
jgi:threonine/homoserine/homoserine lactone efflux protein